MIYFKINRCRPRGSLSAHSPYGNRPGDGALTATPLFSVCRCVNYQKWGGASTSVRPAFFPGAGPLPSYLVRAAITTWRLCSFTAKRSYVVKGEVRTCSPIDTTSTPGEFNPMDMPNSVKLAAEVVAAYVSYNPVPRGDLKALILAVHSAVDALKGEPNQTLAHPEAKTPAVPARKSITPEYLICLEDGKHFKSMRRHLTLLGITPQQYRQKWNLPSDYPMVAPNYAAQRSALAKKNGLGQMGGTAKSGKKGRQPKSAA
jgi:predicted transcriptional regulator